MKLTPSSGRRLSVRSASASIRRRAPDALAGDAHGAEAEAMDGEVAADLEAAGFAGIQI